MRALARRAQERSRQRRCGIDCRIRKILRLARKRKAESRQTLTRKRVAPRVGFEPTTNRLTAGCSTTELPRNSRLQTRGFYQVRRQGESPQDCANIHPSDKTRPPCGGLEGVGYGGVSPREDVVNIALTGKDRVNANNSFTLLAIFFSGTGGLARNRTGVHGFAIRCVTTPPRGQPGGNRWSRRGPEVLGGMA